MSHGAEAILDVLKNYCYTPLGPFPLQLELRLIDRSITLDCKNMVHICHFHAAANKRVA